MREIPGNGDVGGLKGWGPPHGHAPAPRTGRGADGPHLRKHPKMSTISCLSTAALALSLTLRAAAADPLVVTVALDPQTPGLAIPPQAEGLSYESTTLMPRADGSHYFSAANAPLVRLFHSLGVTSLRLGGVTIDRPTTVISTADVDELFAFAKAAGAKVIYSVPLKDTVPASTQPLIAHIRTRYADLLDSLAIGNEPNVFYANFTLYTSNWNPYFDLTAQQQPGLPICGPSAWDEAWANQFSQTLSAARAQRLAYVTQHEYSFGPASQVRDAGAARDRMLAQDGYTAWYQRFVPAALARGFHYRIEEASNYSNGGALDVSDTYAAALWSLDYLYWWCAHQALGINFHTGDFQNYSAFKTVTGGYAARPLAYGMLAFGLGGHGRFIPASVAPGVPGGVLHVYATTAAGITTTTVINRTHGATARDARVTLTVPAGTGAFTAESCALAVAGGDAAAKTGITVGGAAIATDGQWHGVWTPLSAVAGQAVVAVPAASAVLVRFTATTADVPPVATAQSVSTTQGGTKAITLAGSDSDGTIVGYAYGQPAHGTVRGSGPVVTYTPAAGFHGADSFTFTVADNGGLHSSAATVAITVTALDAPPTVTVTAPSGPFLAPATIVLGATAADSDGSVAKVEFYAGATKIGEDAGAPYACTWTGVAAGTYQVTAKATDDAGATGTSAIIVLTVLPHAAAVPPTPAAPHLTTTPAGMVIGGTTAAGATVTVFIDGVSTATVTADGAGAYSWPVSGLASGDHAVTVTATNGAGTSPRSPALAITVPSAPGSASTASSSGGHSCGHGGFSALVLACGLFLRLRFRSRRVET